MQALANHIKVNAICIKKSQLQSFNPRRPDFSMMKKALRLPWQGDSSRLIILRDEVSPLLAASFSLFSCPMLLTISESRERLIRELMQ